MNVLVAALAAGLLITPAPAERSGRTIERAGGALAGAVITLDPGHNGANGAHPDEINQQVPIGNGETKECDTTGTQTESGYTESAYTLSVARRLRRLLESAGAKVVMTRKTDDGVGPCIDERARIGNRAGSDAALSIHADGGPSSGRGFHVIRPAKTRGLTDDIYGPSRKLAARIRGAYERGTSIPPATYIGDDGIDERSDLGGLRLSNVPKVFIETANMNNARDAKKLESGKYRQRIAAALFDGLNKFVKRNDR